MDAPEGTSLEGSQEMAFKLLKELQGIPGRRRHRAAGQPGRQRRGGRRRRQQRHARALQRAGAAGRGAQADPGADDRGDAPAAAEVSGVPAEHHRRATRSAAARAPAASRSPRTSSAPTSTQLADYSLKALGGGAADAEPRRAEVEPERLEPGDPRRGRSPARRRSRRPDGDHRQHAAAGGRRATIRSRSTRKGRSSTRSRSACSRTSGATRRRSAG